jgi:hypothetical protein
MIQKADNKGFTLVEAMIVAAIIMLLMGFAWKFYFGGRETMRHTVSQSQVQQDTRIFLDQLEVEMGSCYTFSEIDADASSFSFYSFVYARTPLDQVLYNSTGKPRLTSSESDAGLKVVKYQYTWDASGKVTKTRTPGWLLFLKEPMEFREGNPDHFIAAYSKMEKVVLRNIVEFSVRGYKQRREPTAPTGILTESVSKEDSEDAIFIILRIHTKKDESANRRDEELDIVTKFFSQTKIAEVANPDYFCTTDREGRF